MPRKIFSLFILAALGSVWVLSPPHGGTLAAQEKAAGQKKLPRLLAAKPLSTTDQKDELRRLVRERYNAALEEARERYRQLREVANTNPDTVCSAFRRLLASGVLAADTGRARLEFLQAYLELARDFEKLMDQLTGGAAAKAADRAHARYLRVDAELQLLRTRRDLSGPKGTGGK
jgi:hypothetical protein